MNRVKRLLGILMLAGLLGVGPGGWLQLHLAYCCGAPVPVGNSDQICHGPSHNADTCPVCSALHAPITSQDATALLNFHSLLAWVAPEKLVAVDHSRPIPTDCRGPPAADLVLI